MSEAGTPQRRNIPFFLAIILIMLILSIIALYQAVNAYLSGASEGNYLMMLGTIGLAMSAYMLFRTRRGVPRLTLEMQRVATTILCGKCGFKKIRGFERGDYIFKEAEPCPKCDEEMMIASIYREVKEKGKR